MDDSFKSKNLLSLVVADFDILLVISGLVRDFQVRSKNFILELSFKENNEITVRRFEGDSENRWVVRNDDLFGLLPDIPLASDIQIRSNRYVLGQTFSFLFTFDCGQISFINGVLKFTNVTDVELFIKELEKFDAIFAV